MGPGDTIRTLVPLVGVCENYSFNSLRIDMIAGLTVGVMLLPQAMAYAQLAMLPPIYGLYTSVFPAVLYAVFSESHTMSLGTIALCGLLTADIITDELSDPEEQVQETIAIALCVGFLSGVILFVVALLQLGESVQRYLSPALVGGFHTGAAIHIMVSQFSHVLGVPRAPVSGVFGIPRKIYFYATELPSTNLVTFGVAMAAFVVIFTCKKVTTGQIAFGLDGRTVQWVPKARAKRLRFPIPAELIAVVLFEVVSSVAELNQNHGVKVVGNQDSSILQFENLDWDLAGGLISRQYMEIMTIAVITFSLTLSDAKTYADETDRPFSGNREMAALAIANLISPFTGSYVAGAGISRSAVAYALDTENALTQVYTIVSAVVVLIAIPFIHVISNLPQAVLAAVVLSALHGMVMKQGAKCSGFLRFGRKDDFLTWLVSLLSTVLIDLDWGLLLGLLMTVHSVFLRLNQAQLTTLGKVSNTQFFDDLAEGTSEFPGVKIIRLNSPLFFGSKDRFYKEVRDEVTRHAAAVAHTPTVHKAPRKAAAAVPYHTLVIDASAMIFLDTAGAQQLATLASWLWRNHGARLLVACGSENFVTVFRRVEFECHHATSKVLFPSVHDAVMHGISLGMMDRSRTSAVGQPATPRRSELARQASLPDVASALAASGRRRSRALFTSRTDGRHDTGLATQFTPLLNPGATAVENPSFVSDANADPAADVMVGIHDTDAASGPVFIENATADGIYEDGAYLHGPAPHEYARVRSADPRGRASPSWAGNWAGTDL